MNKIKNIEVITDFQIQPVKVDQSKAQLGFAQKLSQLSGFSSYDGYKIETEEHTYLVLIDNGQSCCESWGYLSSEDDLKSFIGDELLEVTLTDTALNTKPFEKAGYLDSGSIKFVTFKTDKSVFQLAVYNAHNGYYGHGILIAKDKEVLLSETI